MKARQHLIAANETTHERAILLVSEIAERYRLASLRSLIDSSRALAERDELSIAVIGRFKAGKSSFLNHFLERDLLPVGVTPVTAVVTEIGYGKQEKAVVHFLDGRTEQIALDRVRHFIAESQNPENEKQVSTMKIELPQLAGMRGLHFVDMPGLESALAHNTEAALKWLPNVELALVAVSVDPPLSQQDLALLKTVYDYTPNVSILLTKVDLVSQSERAEVIDFVGARITQVFGSAPQIFPYSVRPGYEDLKHRVEEMLIKDTLSQFEEHRTAVLGRKTETALRECHDYLALALKSGETIGAERETLKRLVDSEKQALAEQKSELRLIVNHAAGSTRATVARRLESHQKHLESRLSSGLVKVFPAWSQSLRVALESFEHWLNRSLANELMSISAAERSALLDPLDKLKKQVFRSLQNFRDRLSARAERAFSIPLHTTESEIVIAEPRMPDIYIGKVFDRNWELLSPLVPMSLVKPLVWRHFMNRVPYMIEKNLSRLTTQWDESIRAAMSEILKEAQRRLDELVETVERLIATSHDEAPGIRADLESIDSIARAL